MKCDNIHYNTGENNPMYGKKHSPETIMKMRLIKRGEHNPVWQDIPTIVACHLWINRNFPKPELCESCNENKRLDLANVTGTYNRESINWKYLCRSCHMKFDYKSGVRKWRRIIDAM